MMGKPKERIAPSLVLSPSLPLSSCKNPSSGAQSYNFDVSFAGDVNGDGYADLMIGSNTEDANGIGLGQC